MKPPPDLSRTISPLAELSIVEKTFRRLSIPAIAIAASPAGDGFTARFSGRNAADAVLRIEAAGFTVDHTTITSNGGKRCCWVHFSIGGKPIQQRTQQD
jgi:hypothetical protein